MIMLPNELEYGNFYFDASQPSSYIICKGATNLKRTEEGKKCLLQGTEAIDDWLRKQDIYMLHNPIARKSLYRQTLVYGPGDQIQVYLVDIQSHAEDKYMKKTARK